jgi:hypothetical protein
MSEAVTNMVAPEQLERPQAEMSPGASRMLRIFTYLQLERTFGTPEGREATYRDLDAKLRVDL